MEEKNLKELYVPENCPPLQYVFTGFVAPDIVAIAICVLCSLFPALKIIVQNQNIVGGIMIIMATAFMAILFFHRDRYGENTVDKIRVELDYMGAEKEYLYEYINVYEQLSEKSRNGAKNETKRNKK